MEKDTTYLIGVSVRDANGNILECEKGIRVPSIDFEITVYNYEQLEFQMRRIHRQFKALLPQHNINIEAGLLNEISGTIMCMASFYGGQDRFVKH